MRVIGYHISSTGIAANSDGEWADKPPYFDWLLGDKPEAIKIFYYMTQDIANLCKIGRLSQDEVRKLNSKNNKAYLPPYKLHYIPNRFFKLSKGFYSGSPWGYWSDAHQYVNTVARSEENVEDCLARANEAQKIGEEVFRALQSLGLKPTSLTSPIKVFEKAVLSKLHLPNVDDLPEEAGYYAYQCCKGNWVEAFRLGHWEKVWNYDLCSAYPAQTAKLLDTRFGKWVQSKEFMPEATYGYCKGILTINKDVEFTPFIYKQDNEKNLPVSHNVVGTYSAFLTKREIEFLGLWKQGSFKIENGWWWLAEKEVRPLEQTINWLFLEKERVEGIRQSVIKRIMSAVFGKMLEVRDEEMGEMMNPVWAAEVETNTRLEVADFVLRNHAFRHLIHIAVDSAITAEPVLLGEQGIGKWELDTISPCLCAGTGAVAIRDEGIGEFHLKYDWLREQIEKEPEASEYRMVKQVPVTIGEACGEKFEKLGELQDLVKTVAIGQGEKRAYREQPKCGRDLLSRTYESLPWDVSLVNVPSSTDFEKQI